jgi:NADH-quinone oxidoreductase subunit A
LQQGISYGVLYLYVGIFMLLISGFVASVLVLARLIFDVEAAFLYPWAVIYRELGLYGFVEMVIFVLILGVGLVYAWKKGALKWV